MFFVSDKEHLDQKPVLTVDAIVVCWLERQPSEQRIVALNPKPQLVAKAVHCQQFVTGQVMLSIHPLCIDQFIVQQDPLFLRLSGVTMYLPEIFFHLGPVLDINCFFFLSSFFGVELL